MRESNVPFADGSISPGGPSSIVGTWDAVDLKEGEAIEQNHLEDRIIRAYLIKLLRIYSRITIFVFWPCGRRSTGHLLALPWNIVNLNPDFPLCSNSHNL